MPQVDDHLRAILAGSPELLRTPSVTVALAVGMAQQGGAVDAHAIGQTAALATHHLGLQKYLEDMAQITEPPASEQDADEKVND